METKISNKILVCIFFLDLCLFAAMPAHAQKLVADIGTARHGIRTSAITAPADNAAAPIIHVQPSAQTATAGHSASFSVVTIGARSYRWQVCIDGEWTTVEDGNIYFNATTRTLTIHNVPNCYNGYTCVCHAINDAGVTVSKSVRLTVNPSYTVVSPVAVNRIRPK